ncbi:hypothetical protein FRX31_010817 [Thalictrum thalictroides]|uniref:Uncharacterized protein n=1 Tax=Thalictrum thalictroides TaxID=46969 RepID=A0A7J6WQF6_THATH|nr:hypothetical protein FRX31_010817 [Thalictrum thalictroides]
MNDRLSGWATKFISRPGKVTMFQSTQSMLPSHHMKGFKLPRHTTKTIDQIGRNFLWGSTTEKRKLHLVNWDFLDCSRWDSCQILD